MNRKEIEKRINEVFIETFELEEKELLPEKRLFSDLGLDSLDIVDLIVEIYKKTGINMKEDEEIRNVRTLGDVYDYLEKWIKKHPEKLK
jgi:acyl carrier protein